jgi:FkbM family methyltransferase
MMNRIKRWLKTTRAYPALRAVKRAFHRPTRAERIIQRDDRLTDEILKRLLRPADNCVDVGSHAGDVLALFLKLCPAGKHIAVEPIPHMAAALRAKFPQAEVHHAALSDIPGEMDFHIVVNSPALSGLQPRPDLPQDCVIERVPVAVRRLDDLVPDDRPIRLIKIDVEGAELGVLRGATRVMAANRPWVIFEHGGASSGYGTTSADVLEELSRYSLAVWKLEDWVAGQGSLTAETFAAAVATGEYWNFLAGPSEK